jgi:fibronectin-binding autotransporter adhesin
LPAVPVTLTGNTALGGTTTFEVANDFTISGAIGDGGNAYALNKVGANAVTFTNTNTYTGTTTITAGSLILSGSGTITGSSLTNNGTFDISGVTGGGVSIVSLAGSGTTALGNKTLTITAAAATFAGDINGSLGNLVIAGGTQLLTGANGYTGTTTINTGATLQIGSGLTTGTLGGGAVTNNGTLILNRSDAITVTNAISGSGNLTQAGTNTVTLSADNSYGTTTINAWRHPPNRQWLPLPAP